MFSYQARPLPGGYRIWSSLFTSNPRPKEHEPGLGKEILGTSGQWLCLRSSSHCGQKPVLTRTLASFWGKKTISQTTVVSLAVNKQRPATGLGNDTVGPQHPRFRNLEIDKQTPLLRDNARTDSHTLKDLEKNNAEKNDAEQGRSSTFPKLPP